MEEIVKEMSQQIEKLDEKIGYLIEEVKELKTSNINKMEEVFIKEDEDIVIVYGKTYKIRENIKKLSGKWNKSDKHWEIEGNIEDILKELSKEALSKNLNIKRE